MKAIIFLLTAALGSYVTLLNVEHLVGVNKQINSIVPDAMQKLTPNLDENGNNPGDGSAPPITPLSPVSDVLRAYGEPTRRERAMDGTTVYYYPYYIIYVRGNLVVNSRRIAAPVAHTETGPNTTAGRFWGNNSLGSSTTGLNQAPQTTNPGWQGRTNSLGSVSLNGSGPSHPATTNPGWQGGGGSVGTVSRPVVSTVHSSGAAMYRSSGGGSSAGSGQWQH